MSDYEDYEEDPPRRNAYEQRSRPGPTMYVLTGLAVGVVAGVVLVWIIGGNPFSTANEVTYQDVVVGTITDEASICWAEDPERRDSSLECAILSIDPTLAVPSAGDQVTIGLVEIQTPDGAVLRQVVHVAQTGGAPVDGTPLPTGPAETPGPDGTPTP